MKKPSIPNVPMDVTPTHRAFLGAVKENIEAFRGLRGGSVDELPTTATTAEIAAKINEIIAVLQGT